MAKENDGTEMRYDAVIYDLDGTLLNTLDDLTDSVNHILGEYGAPGCAPEQVRAALGNGARVLLTTLAPKELQGERFEQMLAEYGDWYNAHCRIKTRPYPGVEELTKTLKEKGVKQAIVSNKGDTAVKELAQLYFADVLEAAVGERPGIRRKPEPDSVLEAMRQLGVSPERTLYVGDSEVDHMTARRAHLPVALVSWGFRDRDKLEMLKPEFLADGAGELLDWICRG